MSDFRDLIYIACSYCGMAPQNSRFKWNVLGSNYEDGHYMGPDDPCGPMVDGRFPIEGIPTGVAE